MAYTNPWDESAPPGSVNANTIDTIIQALKIDIRERLEDFFPDWANDGVDPKLPIFGYPRGVVTRAGAQTLTSATSLTVVTWTAEVIDEGGMIDLGSSATEITIPTGLGGIYRLNASLRIEANALGYRSGAFYINNSIQNDSLVVVTAVDGQVSVVSLDWIGALSAGDDVAVRVQQNSTSSLGLTNSRFSVVRIA